MSQGKILREVGDRLGLAGKERAAMWTGAMKDVATDSGTKYSLLL